MRIPDKRGDHAYFRRVEAALGRLSGIERLAVNPSTGSVLLEYACPIELIDEAATNAGLYRTAPADPGASARQRAARARPPTRRRRGAGRSPPESMPSITTGLFAVLTALGLLQLLRGQLLAPAITLLWYAYTLRGGVDRR